MANELAVLSHADHAHLEMLEQRVDFDLATVREGLATANQAWTSIKITLQEIHDTGLYKATHTSFNAYCKEKWGKSRRQIDRMIEESKVAATLQLESPKSEPTDNGQQNETIVSDQSQTSQTSQSSNGTPEPNKGQLKALGKIKDEKTRNRIWREACDKYPNGKPTLEELWEVITDRTGIERQTREPRKAAPEPPEAPKLLSRLNGVLIPDPPDVAKWRAEGKYEPDEIVDILEPENPTTLQESIELYEERKAIEEESKDSEIDEEWIKKLPLYSRLKGNPLKIFTEDALAWRRMQQERERWKKVVVTHYNRVKNKPPRTAGPWLWRMFTTSRCEPPEKWHICPGPTVEEGGGCSGTGVEALVVNNSKSQQKCGRCNGHGYWINWSTKL